MHFAQVVGKWERLNRAGEYQIKLTMRVVEPVEKQVKPVVVVMSDRGEIENGAGDDLEVGQVVLVMRRIELMKNPKPQQKCDFVAFAEKLMLDSAGDDTGASAVLSGDGDVSDLQGAEG